MSETVDLTVLSGRLKGLERDMRLLRVQLDQLAGNLPPRLGSIDARLGVLEQSFHLLAAAGIRANLVASERLVGARLVG